MTNFCLKMCIWAKTFDILEKRLGLSQEAFSEQLDLGNRAVSLWEVEKTFPTVSKLILIRKFFDVPLDDLLFKDLSGPKPKKKIEQEDFYQKD